MVKVKKETINRESFEREMDEIKNLVRQGTDPDVVILAINNAKSRLIEFIDEKDAEMFRIPDWLNQDTDIFHITVTAKELGE